MTRNGDAGLPAAEVAAAEALGRLADGLLSRTIDPATSAEVAAGLERLVERIESLPRRTKIEAFASYPGHQRIEEFVATGSWPAPPADGADLVFDALSFVGGPLNPVSAGLRFRRDGEEAVAVGSFGSCYEGPPNRVHGGAVASAFDEVMGAVFRVLGMASSFTGTLSVRYVGPAPLGADLEFRARLVQTSGRKHEVEATGHGPDGVFATATGVFIELSPEQFAAAIEAGGA